MEVRDSLEADADLLGPHLRAADKAEVMAAEGISGTQALRTGFRLSKRCLTLWSNGKPAAMFGVAPHALFGEEVSFGAIWLLGSDACVASPKSFMRLSRRWCKTIIADFDIVGNVVDCRNATHIRWIKSLGFQFTLTHLEYGAAKIPFLEFMMIGATPHV